MFGFNFSKKKISLGIDIGDSAIKMVEMEWRDEKPFLSNYAWAPVEGIDRRNNGNNPDFFKITLAEYLKKIIKEARFKGKNSYVAIPASEGLITLIDFPEVPASDMEQAIKYEAQKYIPTSLDEVGISWEVVENNPENWLASDKTNKVNKNQSNNSKKIKVLLVVASKNEIVAYEEMVKNAKLNLKGVEIETISMVNSLVGNDKGSFIIVDIGFKVCNIVYVQKGIIIANRSIDAGGMDLTRTIAKSVGVSNEKAEAMKVSHKNFFSQESGIQFPALELILEEVKRILENFSQNGNYPDMDALILSGGTANLTGLKDLFQKRFNIKTIKGNPFSRVSYDKKLNPVIEKIKSQFSVSAGLALRGLERIK